LKLIDSTTKSVQIQGTNHLMNHLIHQIICEMDQVKSNKNLCMLFTIDSVPKQLYRKSWC